MSKPIRNVRCRICGREFVDPCVHKCCGGMLKHVGRQARTRGWESIFVPINQHEESKPMTGNPSLKVANCRTKPDTDPTWCGLKDDPDFVQCCCNCIYHVPVHFNCYTKPNPTDAQKKAAGVTGRCVCGVQKGWACHNPEMSPVIYDNWPEHSCGCECYTAKK